MTPKAQISLWFACAAMLMAAAAWGFEGYSLRLLNLALLNVITVLGLNLAFGYCGIIHLGQAAFVGIGAYISALLTVRLGWPMYASVPIALMTAAAFALLISGPLTRVKGHYLALATVGVNVVLEQIARNWVEVTNGYNGITGIPRLTDFVPWLPAEQAFLPIVGGAALLVAWLALRLRESHLGRAMIAVRDDETAAQTVGIDIAKTKMIAFTLSGVCGALSGVLFAHYTGFISPTDFAVAQSILFLMMLVVGGEASVVGAVLGAIALTFLPELMRDLAANYVAAGGNEKGVIARVLKDGYLIAYGLITLFVLIVLPRGIAGLIRRRAGIVS
ncbi:MAG: branched-chain amino acid ABC transporter permease [Rhodospirillaceae bacterium]|nr:branched-chain amino acid ABC transporter permease [Rhodospirillaceae bacterium]